MALTLGTASSLLRIHLRRVSPTSGTHLFGSLGPEQSVGLVATRSSGGPFSNGRTGDPAALGGLTHENPGRLEHL